MITDSERKSATLALETLHNNLKRLSPRADGNYNAGDLMWAVEEAIAELTPGDEESGES
jgi:hypothetical protein